MGGARTIPIAASRKLDVSLKWCSTPPLWHTKAVGGSTPSEPLSDRARETIPADKHANHPNMA
jgi:hypothetical protein